MPRIGNRAKIVETLVTYHVLFLEALENMQRDPVEDISLEMPSTSESESYRWLGDVPGLSEWLDDREMSTLLAEGFDVKNRDWANGVRIHRNEIMDDKLGMVRPRLEMLARRARQHYGDLLVGTLANGFDGANSHFGNGRSYDGAFFFSDSHQSQGGPTQSNKLTSALAYDSYEDAIQKMLELKNDSGSNELGLYPTHLVVGPKNWNLARRITRGQLVVNPEGTGVAAVDNIHAGEVTPMLSRKLTGSWANYWFLADLSQPIRPMVLQIREPITSDAIDDVSGGDIAFRKGEYHFGAHARHAAGYLAWQTVVGSTGAS